MNYASKKEQIRIYVGKFFRNFLNEKGWVSLIGALIIPFLAAKTDIPANIPHAMIPPIFTGKKQPIIDGTKISVPIHPKVETAVPPALPGRIIVNGVTLRFLLTLRYRSFPSVRVT